MRSMDARAGLRSPAIYTISSRLDFYLPQLLDRLVAVFITLNPARLLVSRPIRDGKL